MTAAPALTPDLKRTPLYDTHVALGARMVPFAGYMMPVQYLLGIVKEHQHTRSSAGLFDISHMGQVLLSGGADIRAQIEKIMPGDFQELEPGQIRYSFLLNDDGGVIDDLMVTRPVAASEQNTVFVIVNASNKDIDVAHMKKHLPDIRVEMLDDRALIALQGPDAAKVLARFNADTAKLKFMQARKFAIKDIGECFISRSGYTGEDGFEISVPGATVVKFFKALLEQPEVKAIGLGARDSLRLEAGLCLHGHDLDTSLTPIEADLLWAIGKRRRQEGGFIGAARIKQQIAEGASKKRVGIKPDGRVLARENTEILDAAGKKIGIVTSGGFGPSVDGPVCMGYVDKVHSAVATPVFLVVRGERHAARIVKLPFAPHRYMKG